jgi:hypothetical protein
MATPTVIQKVISWLRAGYPEGVPQHDYLPLFALLGSELTNDEVTLIIDELTFSAAPESKEAVQAAISAVTNTKPSDADINRVRARLAAGGWPLARPE